MEDSSNRPVEPAALSASVLDGAVELMGRCGRGGAMRVQGASMRPTLEPGAVLQVDFAPARLRFGDLVIVRREGFLVVHRLVSRAGRARPGRKLRTRGDGRLELDPAFDAARVVGRVTGVLREGGWRSLEGVGPRAYARCIAAHDLLWAAAGSAVGRLERLLARAGVAVALRDWIRRADRLLLGLVDRMAFDAVHRPLEPLRGEARPAGSSGSGGDGAPAGPPGPG